MRLALAEPRTPVILMKAVVHAYPSASGPVTVLKGIDLVVSRGEYVAIVGPSGSGKSTLLSCLGCLEKPSAGRYHLEGKDVSELDDDETTALRNRRIGFVFQAYNLIPTLTVAENVALPLLYANVSDAERLARALRALERVGLRHRADAFPEQLSGGQKQRVAIARAVVVDPALILADEPTGALDTGTASEVVSLLEELNREGSTLVIVTHDRSLAMRARRRIELVDGVVHTEIER